jgi:hypothetical protein
VKPLASLSLDLDNEWSYLKTHGDKRWESLPSYMDVLVPRVLEVLEQMKLRITFFVVGQDAALDKNREPLARLGASHHEIGSHSFRHEPWFHLYSPEEVDRELAETEEVIEAATGRHPRGFRGPGFSVSETTLRALVRRGYRYDASTLPTFIGPLARAYYFMTAKLDDAERDKRAHLFGDMRDALRPIRPYYWQLDGGAARPAAADSDGASGSRLLEIPVTTFPGLRVPIHASYVLYLSCFSPPAASMYFKTALAACRAFGVEPSILLHPLDFLGREDVSGGLSFFPAMQLSREVKLQRIRRYLGILARHFEVVPMVEHAEAIEARSEVRLVVPRFRSEVAGG